MAQLRYTTNISLDGYIEDASGSFDWSVPDERYHAYVNDLERPVGTYLYGRRLYETMRVWETFGDLPPVQQDYAEIWRAAQKVVFSRTLDTVSTPRTRLERAFDVDGIRRRKDEALAPLTIGGAELAATALRAGLVDEVHLLVHPISVGGGRRALPEGVRLDLDLRGEHAVNDRVVHLHYAVAAPT